MSRNESIVNSINDDGLPSYEDVIREEQAQAQAQGRISSYGSSNSGSSNNYLNVPPPPKRPPQKPPRPNTSSNTPSASSSTSHLRPSVARPPPPPSSSQNSMKISSNSGRPSIPWVYPSNFHCPKCNNTGYKLKNGKSCRSCWRRFCPKNPINYNMGPTSSSFYVSPSIGMSSPYPPPTNNFGYGYGCGYPPAPPMSVQQQQHPLVVRPGDPRLGGVLCGECRGTGRVSFLLDDDLCPLCNGLGRIVTHR